MRKLLKWLARDLSWLLYRRPVVLVDERGCRRRKRLSERQE